MVEMTDYYALVKMTDFSAMVGITEYKTRIAKGCFGLYLGYARYTAQDDRLDEAALAEAEY